MWTGTWEMSKHLCCCWPGEILNDILVPASSSVTNASKQPHRISSCWYFPRTGVLGVLEIPLKSVIHRCSNIHSNQCESMVNEQGPSTNVSIMYGPPPRSATQFQRRMLVLLRTRSVHSTLPNYDFIATDTQNPRTCESKLNLFVGFVSVWLSICLPACLSDQNLASVAPYSILGDLWLLHFF